jgi:hypothetical protein
LASARNFNCSGEIMRWIAHVVALVCVGWLATAPAHAQPAEDPMDATVFIRVYVVGPDATGNIVKKQIRTGTGFIIHEQGWVATALHLLAVERLPPNSKVVLEGSIRSGSAGDAYPLVKPLLMAKEADIALLRLPTDLGIVFPYLCLERTPDLSIGRPIAAYGFPLGGPNTRRTGDISSTANEDGLILISGGLQPGMSGGPVMADNSVIGVITSGIGTNAFDYFTPVNYARPHFDTPPAYYAGSTCPSSVPQPPPQQEFIERVYRIDETNDTHDSLLEETTLPYSVTLDANPGYRIIEAQVVQESATRVSDLTRNISGDEQSVTVSFKLTAGPRIDRYRGWLHANVIVRQKLRQ